MPKVNEINQLRNYFTSVDAEAGTKFVLDKPFSHEECPRYLIDLGRVMSLLPPAPARILDLGVGMGWTSVFLAKRGYTVVGQDICGDLIDLAGRVSERYEAGSVTFLVQDYEAMNFREEFDGALFYDSLHHAEDEKLALAKVYAALKAGGVCVTVEPGEGHANSEPTLKYVKSYGVTEKDMPPRHIISLSEQVGFRSFKVYHRDLDTTPNLVADLNACPSPSPSGSRPGRAAVALRFAKKAARAMIKGTCDEDHSFLFGWRRPAAKPELRESNIVWMQK